MFWYVDTGFVVSVDEASKPQQVCSMALVFYRLM
jgi:hypothetical protein